MSARSRLPPEKSLAFQIRRAHLAFDRMLTPRLSRHGVKHGYYNYLRALWIKDRVSQRDLSDTTSVTETTTVALLKGMEKDGLITRGQDTVDRRRIYVSLTPAGRALEPLLLPYAKQLNDIALRGISAAEIETCLSVVKRVAANLEAAMRTNGTD
jgi:DNA-binding MarR family transcriptional regulator